MEIYSATKKMQTLLVLFLFDTVFAENYIITRRSTSASVVQPDLFQIPPSLCSNNGTTECPLMDAEKDSAKMCQCVCNQEDGSHSLYKTTFHFHNETWKCAKNAELHRLSGCSFSLDGVDENAFVTLRSSVTVRHSLSNITTPAQYIHLPEGKTCAIKAQDSTYLKCNGEWEQLNSTIVGKRFQISYETSDGKYLVRVWVNATERIVYPLPAGRIIRVGVTCSDRPWEPSQCIVAKIEGQLRCPVSPFSVSATTTPRPSITASPVLTSVTPSLSTTKPLTVSSSEIPSSITQTSSPVTSSTSFPTSPSSPKPNTTAVPTVKGGADSGNIFSGTLIGAVLGGIAGLLALVIMIVIIAKRRNVRSISRIDDRKNSRAAMVVENESFEQGDNLEDGSNHTYAHINPSVAPSSASALNDNGKGGHRNSVANKVYEVVEELDNPNQGSKSNPKTANNNGQRDPTIKTRKELLPAIPEPGLFITFKDRHNYENVNNNSGPQYVSYDLYDVIDGPQSNDSLEEINTRAHGASSNMPSETGSLYDTVGDIIKD